MSTHIPAAVDGHSMDGVDMKPNHDQRKSHFRKGNYTDKRHQKFKRAQHEVRESWEHQQIKARELKNGTET
jgi:hypothetical protein